MKVVPHKLRSGVVEEEDGQTDSGINVLLLNYRKFCFNDTLPIALCIFFLFCRPKYKTTQTIERIHTFHKRSKSIFIGALIN